MKRRLVDWLIGSKGTTSEVGGISEISGIDGIIEIEGISEIEGICETDGTTRLTRSVLDWRDRRNRRDLLD